jgi:hypothetical protein
MELYGSLTEEELKTKTQELKEEGFYIRYDKLDYIGNEYYNNYEEILKANKKLKIRDA